MTITNALSVLSSSEIVIELKIIKSNSRTTCSSSESYSDPKGGYILQINESSGSDFRRYSYHLQKGNKMIKRWDNSPRWKNLKTFPHHVHRGEEKEPRESPEVFIEDVLREVEKILSSKSEWFKEV
jgi:hypothetical protein